MENSKKYIHILPNFHYDVEYLRTYEEYLDISLKNIIEALRLLKKYPEYFFMVEQVILLQEFWNRYPYLRNELKNLVRQGRFEIACGMYCMPDMNIPSGESLIDQVKKGKEWIKKTFGTDVRVCWIADCFGHHSQLPQIVKKCGYDYYFFSRGATDKVQGDFIWEGIDGSSILTHRGPRGYSTLILRQKDIINAEDLNIAQTQGKQAVLSSVEKVIKHSASHHFLCSNGGDFMSPQEDVVDIVSNWQDDEFDCKFSTALEYFQSIEAEEVPLRELEEDFNPVYMGIYASRIAIKQKNRQMENKLLTLERLEVLSQIANIHRNNNGKLEYCYEEAKRLTLYNQFHDIICGTIVDQAYLDTINRYKEAERLVDLAISETFDSLAEPEDHSGLRTVSVFNPSSFKRKENAEIAIELQDEAEMTAEVWDDNRNVLSVTQSRRVGKQLFLLFPVEVEGMSIRQYSVKLIPAETHRQIPVYNEDAVLSFKNSYYSIKIEKNGVISSLKNNRGEELVDQNRPYFNDIEMQSDYGDLWTYNEAPHNGGHIFREKRQFPYLDGENGFMNECYGHSKNSREKAEIVEWGPIRYTVKVQGSLNFWRVSCTYTKYISLYTNSPRIDFKTEVGCKGKNYRLRACFPTSIKNGKIEHEIPFGTCERREEEYAAMNWVSYREGKKGLLMMNRGLPGNNIHNGVMMLSLMRSTSMEYKCESDLAFEEGRQFCFEYSILPYDGELNTQQPWRLGECYNLPLYSRMYDGISDYKNTNILKLDADNVMVSRIHVTGNGWLFRVYEAGGLETACRVNIKDNKMVNCTECDMIGNSIGIGIELDNGILDINLKLFEIRTFLVTEEK